MSNAAAAISAGVSPRFSFATMYAPPPLGYAWMVWRYEKTTIARIEAITTAIGLAKVFLITPGRIEEIAGLIDVPAQPAELMRLALLLAQDRPAGPIDDVGAERIGVVAHHLFLAKATHGVFIPLGSIDEASVAKGYRDLDFCRLSEEAFAASPSDSIDYAVMEHTRHAVVVPASIGWNDVGSWSALWEVQQRDENGNVCRGDVYLDGVKNSLVRAESRCVAVIGVEDVVIVETNDAVLVTHNQKPSATYLHLLSKDAVVLVLSGAP